MSLRIAIGAILAMLPRRWRKALPLDGVIPWDKATMASGFLESVLALFGLVYWYSRSVTTWAANALDSALHGGPESAVPGQAIGFSALVLWSLHPLTWIIGFFAVEGLVRMLAAFITEQSYGAAPLRMVDWIYGKISGRPAEGDDLHAMSGKEQLRSLVAAVKEKIVLRVLPEVGDELIQQGEGANAVMEIHASRPKKDWIPPRVVRMGDGYFRLEQTRKGQAPRPFVFRLRRLATGVPGRSVIVYEPPELQGAAKPRVH